MKAGEGKIRNERELRERLIALRAKKDVHEKLLGARANELYETVLRPAPIIKQCIRELAADKDVRGDLLKIATNLIAKFFGREPAQPGGSGSRLFETAFSLLGHTPAGRIVNAIRSFFKS